MEFFSYIFIEIKVRKYFLIVKSFFLDLRRQLFFNKSKAILMTGKKHENVKLAKKLYCPKEQLVR